MSRIVALIAALFFTVAGAAVPTSAHAANPTATPPKKLYSLKDERITHPTGLAKSVKHPGTYWAVTNSGETARVFGINSSGKVEAVLRFNAKVKDVEALGVDRNGFIYVADIGDNTASRDEIEIYTIPEPEQLGDQDGVRFHQYDFTYPDGAHDAETLLIDPSTSQLYFVTKSAKGGAIYAAPSSPSRQGSNELSKLAAAPTGAITDGTFLPDGQRAVLRTSADVATVAWGDNPNAIARAAAPGSGDSIAVGPTESSVVTSSAGAIYQLAAPARPVTASPPPKTSATPKPNTNADAAGSDSSGKSHNLTWVIAGAAVFALIITVVTFPPGRRERQDRMAENARLTGQSPQSTTGGSRARSSRSRH
ncbi:hypothetical protein AB0E69_04965 [Kribbella sp. NPDC026611]|uniref:hypothetical protein n=1 Tax=Kribbella sp. NPDC026611 TaxID=3154911 RepID=UPI0033F6E533